MKIIKLVGLVIGLAALFGCAAEAPSAAPPVEIVSVGVPIPLAPALAASAGTAPHPLTAPYRSGTAPIPRPRWQSTTPITRAGPLMCTGFSDTVESPFPALIVKSEPGPPMTLGNAKAELRLIVWCCARGHHVEPDPAELAERCGADTPVLDWRERLVCSRCSGRDVDFVVSGTKRRA